MRKFISYTKLSSLGDIKNLSSAALLSFFSLFAFSTLFYQSIALAQTQKLYHAEYPGNTLYNSELDASNLQAISSSGDGLLDVEVDKAQGFLYWSSFNNNLIYRSRLNGSSPVVLHNTTGNPFGVAIDPTANRIFAAHWSGNTIRCGNLDGTGTLTTIINTSGLATDIEYDPNTRNIYYGVSGSGIWTAQLSPAGCSLDSAPSLLVTNGGRVYGIALDVAGNRMWWTNPVNNTISTSDLNGNSVNLNFCSNQGSWLAGIDYLDGFIYFNDYGEDDSFSSPASSCTPTALGNNTPNRPWGISAVEFNPELSIEKSTNGQDSDLAPGESIIAGSPVVWSYEIENTGDTALLSYALDDSDLGAITNLVSGDLDSDNELDAGEIWNFTAFASAILGQYENTGIIRGRTFLNSVDVMQVSDSDLSHYLGLGSPSLVSFTSSTSDGSYGPGSVINITATYNQLIASGSSMTVVLDNGVSVQLNSVLGSTISGTYTVSATGSGEDSADLAVAGISSENIVSSLSGFSQSSSSIPAAPNNLDDSSNLIIDVTAPLLSEVTAVISPTSDTTPAYVYSSNESGAASFFGDCVGSTSVTSSGNNSIDLNASGASAPFIEGTYSNCGLNVIDAAGNISQLLQISTFSVDTSAPLLTSFSSSTADGTYGPDSIITVTANYDSNLQAGSAISVILDNGVPLTLSAVSGNTVSGNYSVGVTGSQQDTNDLTVSSIVSESVNDIAGNVQNSSTVPSAPNNLLSSSNIVIDTTAPILIEVIQVITPSANPNPDWTYSSSESGSAIFSGDCNSASSSVLPSNNLVVLDSNGSGGRLALGTYSSCQVVVTDIYGNSSVPLPISSFTIIAAAPGGISSGLELWFKADDEVFNDNGLSLASDGQTVERWGDSSGNMYDAFQVDAIRKPLQIISTGDSNNFNPTVSFDGNSDRMPILDKFYDASSSLDQVGIYVAYKTNLSGNWSFIDYDRSEWYQANVFPTSLQINYRGNTAIRDNLINTGNQSDGLPHVAGFIYDNTLADETVMRFDGAEVFAADREALGVPLEDTTRRFGYIGDGSESTDFDSGANNRFYEGDISEVIVYDNLSFTASDKRRIESYLALKYGVTLDGSQGFYENSQSSSVFDLDDGQNSGVAGDFISDWLDVAGLALDTSSSIDQRIAKSVNPSAEMIVSTDSDFSSSNILARPTLTDMTYLVWGHNGGGINASQNTDLDLLSYQFRIEREWKVENTAVQVPVNLKISNLPALPLGKSYQLIVDSDGDFTNGHSLLSTSTNGEFTNVIFPDGVNFITVAFEYDNISLEFDEGSASSLEGIGGDIPLLLINGTVTGSYPLSILVSSTSAAQGVDYLLSVTTIPAGVYDGTLGTAVPVVLSIVNDGVVEPDEILNISLDLSSNSSLLLSDLDGDSVFRDTHDYTILNDDMGPGGVGDRVLFWLRSDRGVDSNVDGDPVSLWEDQLFPVVNGVQAAAAKQPIFNDQVTDEWNFNPVVTFDGADDRIELPDTAFINLSSTPFKVIHLAFETSANITSRQVVYEEGAQVRGFNAYVENNEINFAAWNFANDGVGAPWDMSVCKMPINPESQYVATMVIRGNEAISGTIDCFLNGEESSNPGANIGNLYPHAGDIGIGEINQATVLDNGTSGGQVVTSGAPFEGEIPEIIYFDDFDIDALSHNKIESYLAIKYGVTLFQNAGGQNYLNSFGDVIYDALGTHLLYNNDIAGISLDSGSDFIQPKSKSINSDAVFTIGDATNHDDYEALIWGNDDLTLTTWSSTETEQGYEKVLRTWRFDEEGDVGTVSVEIDVLKIPALDKDEYILLVDADGDFSSGAVSYPLTLSLDVLSASGVEPSGDSYFTIAQRDITPPVLSVVTPVPTPGTNRNPPFTFSSSEAGTSSFSGGCGSLATLAQSGNNSITLDLDNAGGALPDGSYASCAITVTDDCGNVSAPLLIPLFEILGTPPFVSLSVDNTSIDEGSSGTANFTVSLSNPYAASVTVVLGLSGTASASDFSSSSLTVVIPPLGTSASLSVSAINDLVYEFNETVVVDIISVINGAEQGIQQQLTTIIDDEVAPSVILSIDKGAIAESTTETAVVTATLSAVSERPVSVNLSFLNSTATLGPDFNASSSVINIPVLTSSSSISVMAVDDSDDDDGEFIIVDIDSVLNGTELGVQQVQTEIIDDDIGCNENPWLSPVPTNGTVVMSAHGQFTETNSFLPPTGEDFDTLIMGRTAADIVIRRNQAFDYFLSTFGVDWNNAVQVDSATWVTASGDYLLIHAMTDPRYDYRLNAASDVRIHPENGEVYEGVYLMVVINPGGSVVHGSWGGAAGEFLERGSAMVHGEIFATVPVLCNDGSVDPQSYYMLYQSLEPTQNNPNDKVLYNDEIIANDRYISSFGFALSRKGLFLEPGTLDYEAQVTNIAQFYQ